jgi:CDP-2,3-bis-(O-geranylgeranyl)-sn-glycerol synthase
MYYLNIILVSIIFFSPAYAANSIPVLANRFKLFPSLKKPIHSKVFGKSKTYRGFILGVSGALIVGLIQYYSGWYLQLEYSLLLSFLLGFGALLGDLIKSFIKRRIGIKSGDPWIVFDIAYSIHSSKHDILPFENKKSLVVINFLSEFQ